VPDTINRYLIADRAGGPLAELLELIRRDPKIHVVDLLGPAGLPDTIVAEMTDARAAQLRRDSGGQLIVDRDATVEPSQSAEQLKRKSGGSN
jgi:hypothetical protein